MLSEPSQHRPTIQIAALINHDGPGWLSRALADFDVQLLVILYCVRMLYTAQNKLSSRGCGVVRMRSVGDDYPRRPFVASIDDP